MKKPKKSSSPIKIRKRWKMNPRTRLKQSAKRYSRSKTKQEQHKALKDASKKNT